MDEKFKSAIYAADKYARRKTHRCLVPGCQRKAIGSHSIPRASIAEALAVDGKLYTLRQSYNPTMKKAAASDPMDVVEVGVNQAGVFDGFCASHDSQLFAPVERLNEAQKHSIISPLHFRAYSLEFCRKRRNADFLRRMAELTTKAEVNGLHPVPQTPS